MARKTLEVRIVGDASSAKRAFDETEEKADSSGGRITAKLGDIAKVVSTAFAGAAIAVGVGLFKIGDMFDGAYDTIRTKTGQVGASLEGLKDDFRFVVQNVPTDFGAASEVIAGLNQRLGLTGPVLRDTAMQFLELSRITGTDLATNVEDLTRLFGDWSIRTEDIPYTLDKVYRASQLSGVGINTLAQQVVAFGAPLRGLGFSLDESLAMLGKWNKEGVNTELVMGAMKKAFGVFVQEEGAAAPKVFRQFMAEIAAAKSPSEAAGIAIDKLGVKAGPDFAAAVQEGRFSYGDFVKGIAGGRDTILGAGKDTQDFAEKWQMFKNRILVKLEPIATRVFDGMAVAMDRLPAIIDRIEAKGRPVVDWMVTAWPKVRAVIASVVDWIDSTGWPALKAGFDQVRAWVEEFVGIFSSRWEKIKEATANVIAVLRAAWAMFGDEILSVVKAVWANISATIEAGMQVIRGIVDVVLGILTLDFGQAWDGIKEIFSGALGAMWAQVELTMSSIGALFSAGWDIIKTTVSAGADAVVNFITGIPGRVADIGGAIANAIVGGFKAAWNGLAGTVNDAIPDKIGMPWPIPDIDLPDNPIPRLHSGGTFRAAMAGGEGLALLRDGERVSAPRSESIAGAGDRWRPRSDEDRRPLHVEIPLVVSSRELARVVWDEEDERTRRRGGR